MRKGLVSPDTVGFVFAASAVAAMLAPLLGYYLARTDPLQAYRFSQSIWFMWVGGNLVALLWSILYLRSYPWMARATLLAVVISLLGAAALPRI